MPKYSYTAVDLQNKKIKSVAEAKDEDDLTRILRSQSMVPLKYKIVLDKDGAYRLKAKDAAEFARQLSSMLGSGITAVRAMELMKDRDLKPKLKAVYERLYKDVRQGFTLSEAMKMQGNAFPDLLMNMFASGEASGQLERVSSKMADHYEKENRLNGKVKSAMMYPCILLGVTVIVVIIIFTVVLPTMFAMFEGIELPGPTRVILNISGFMTRNWYYMIIAVLIFIALAQYLVRIPEIGLRVDKLKLRFPVVGKLLKIIYTARFSRTLASLYTSGISMIRALEITATIISNKYIESQFKDTITGVRNGEQLSDSIAKIDGFDKKLSGVILIGEESGRLDTMLESIAESFDYEAEMATLRLVQLVEPVMLVVMAVIIGFVMLSVMMPLMSIYQTAANM